MSSGPSAPVGTGSGSHGPVYASRVARAERQLIERQPGDDRHQEGARLADRRPLGPRPAQVGLLHDIFRVPHAAEHPVGQPEQQQPILLELLHATCPIVPLHRSSTGVSPLETVVPTSLAKPVRQEG